MSRPDTRAVVTAEREPLVSVCEISTFPRTFEEDLRSYRLAGADGIGIVEAKLQGRPPDEALRQFEQSGLRASICVPEVPTILPLSQFPGPSDPMARTELLCQSVERLAAFRPAAILCLTGRSARHPVCDQLPIVARGLKTLAQIANANGVTIAVEPFHRKWLKDSSLLFSLTDTLDLIQTVNEPNVGVLFDVWHLWDIEGIAEQAKEHASAIVGVHISDFRVPTRTWSDRALPGEGAIDLSRLLGAIDSGGYRGWYDLEIISDNGALEERLGDSLWDRDPVEMVQQARNGFHKAWARRYVP